MIAAALIFSGASTAQAEDLRPYAGVSVGSYNLDFGLGSDNAVGGFAFFGVNLNENIAIEARAGTTANATYNIIPGVGIDYGVDWMVSYLVKPQFPVTVDLNIYGLLGGTTMKTSFASNLPGTLTKTTTDISYGGGIEYAVSDQGFIGLEWVQYSKKAEINSPTYPGLDVWGASVTFGFEF